MSDQPSGSTPEKFLRLRPDLRCALRKDEGEAYYTIEDLASGSFFRIGLREWELASQLDGATSLAEAHAQLRSQQPSAAMSPQEAQQVVRSLMAAGLVVASGGDDGPLLNATKPGTASQTLSKLNPFFLRFSLLCPDRHLEAALPWCRWLFSIPFFAAWLLVVVGGGYCISSQWQRFGDSTRIYFAPHTWIYLAVVWCLLKVVHEIAHGLVCKRYGGSVGSAGIALILFSPVAYVDVTSAWRFRSKWRRILTSSAGIYCELFFAGMAAIAWSRLADGPASHFCHSVVVMASLSTLLFNANPLMRFDGYFILSDLLEIQNLYGAGQQFVRARLRRLFLGIPVPPATEQDRVRRGVVKIYGVLAAMWRIVVSLSMILLASTLFQGAGVIVALLGVILWYGLPCFRFIRFVIQGQQGQRPNRLRLAAASAMACALAALVLWLPWPGGVSAPAVVVYAPEELVRTSTDGFVAKVHVSAGQQVYRNQALVSLRNDELRAELELAELAVQQSVLRTRMLLNRDEGHAAYQAELEQLAALKTHRDHLQSQVDGLQVRAAMEGVVLGRRLQDLVGRFTEIGTPLFRIAREDSKEIQVSIPEAYFDVFAQHVGASPQVRVRGRTLAVQAGRLTKVEPQASAVLTRRELAATYGGPLAVRHVPPAEPGGRGGEMLELVAPRFHGVVALPPEEAAVLKAGQLAKVRIYDGHETIGRRVFRAAESWIRGKLNQLVVTAHGS